MQAVPGIWPRGSFKCCRGAFQWLVSGACHSMSLGIWPSRLDLSLCNAFTHWTEEVRKRILNTMLIKETSSTHVVAGQFTLHLSARRDKEYSELIRTCNHLFLPASNAPHPLLLSFYLFLTLSSKETTSIVLLLFFMSLLVATMPWYST